MKKTVISLLLVLAMVLSCVGTAFAAPLKTESGTIGTENVTSEKRDRTGFQSELFHEANTYQYAEDEIVRAIVVLESAPEADVAENGSQKAATYRAKLQNEHATVRKAMKSIEYTMQYDFTTLLNGFSCDVAYGDLDAIAAIKGVKAVYIANSYDVPVLEEPETAVSGSYMTGNYDSINSGYAGQGTVIAVLDTGLRTTHEAFQDYGMTEDTITEDDLVLAVAPGAYVNAKVPFAYDYAERDNDVTDYNGHGTHVAGIAGGYAEDADGAVTMAGAAPAAQILAMKIFYDDRAGTTSDIYFYALEDAYRLGADVINMSIGAQNGFTYDPTLESEVFGNIYARLEAAGVIVCVAAGNEYSMDYFSSIGLTGTEYTDYGTVAAPSTYNGNVSVASINNLAYPQFAVELTVDGETAYLPFIDSSDEGLWMSAFAGKTLDYVIVTNAAGSISMGDPADFENADVTGKVAVVSRGNLSFEEKVENAYDAGAIGCIVINTENAAFGMSIDTFEIPAISFPLDALDYFQAADGTLVVPEDAVLLGDSAGGYMSEFSNWGTSPDLTIDPAITSVGGNVYSSVNTADDAYEVYSGTSMACPNTAGTFAVVLSLLKEQGESYEDGEWVAYDKVTMAERAKALLESTGIIIYDSDDYIYSVRKQGAGLANSYNALSTHLFSAYITDPLKELGHDPEKTGVYSFDVTLINEGTADSVTYNALDAVVMTEHAAKNSYGEYLNALTTDYLEPTVEFTVNGKTVDSVTVGLGQSVTVTVTITLTEDEKAYLDEAFPNGAYVEGYVSFANETHETHATFLAYYGNWTQASVLEELNSFDLMEANYLANTTYAAYGADAYAVLYSFYGNFYTDVNTVYAVDAESMSLMTYLGANLMDRDTTEYMTEHLSFSTPESDGTWTWFDAFYITPYQLRNAEHLVMTVSDKETGEVYYVDDTMYLPKASFDTESGYWNSYGNFMWDGADAEGNYVPSGTVATVTFDAMLPYEDTWQYDIWSFDVTVDSTAPTIDSYEYDVETGELTVTATDENYLSTIYITDDTYDILDAVTFSSDVKGETFTATFDLSWYQGPAYVIAMDYASNELEIPVDLFDAGKDATVTVVSPTGIDTYTCKTGDSFTLPECESTEEYSFLFWINQPVEEPMANYWEVLFLPDVTYYFPYESVTIIEPETTFYAFCEHGVLEALEKTNYYATYADDYTGDWAIVGMNTLSNGGYDDQHPQLLNSALEQIDAATAISDIEIDTHYVQFFTNDTSISFAFENVEDDVYTIQAKDTGKYLALGEDGLTLADEVTDAAKWMVTANTQSACASYIYSYAEPDLLLAYDDENQCFALFDDTVVIYEDSSTGYVYYAHDWYFLYLYEAVYVGFAEVNYTTPITYTVTWDVDGNVTTETYVEGTLPEFKGSTDKAADATYTYTFTGWTPELAPVAGDATYTAVYEKTAIDPTVRTGECYYEKFTDCTASWYHEAVDYAVANGLIAGMSDTEFAPNGTLTRAMMVTILYRSAGAPAVDEPSTFTDVPEGKWYSDAIAWAQDNGIVAGTTATTFSPNSAVTREQIAAILWRYVGEPQVEGDLSGFKDADQISGYAKEAMEWANAEGIFVGDGGKLSPKADATRAQFARIIMVFLEGSYVCENMN